MTNRTRKRTHARPNKGKRFIAWDLLCQLNHKERNQQKHCTIHTISTWSPCPPQRHVCSPWTQPRPRQTSSLPWSSALRTMFSTTSPSFLVSRNMYFVTIPEPGYKVSLLHRILQIHTYFFLCQICSLQWFSALRAMLHLYCSLSASSTFWLYRRLATKSLSTSVADYTLFLREHSPYTPVKLPLVIFCPSLVFQYISLSAATMQQYRSLAPKPPFQMCCISDHTPPEICTWNTLYSALNKHG